MKDKIRKNELLRKLLIEFIVKVVLVIVIVPLVFLVFAEIISRLDFNWLYLSSKEAYYFFRNIFDVLFSMEIIIPLVFIIWVFFAIIFLYQLLKRAFSYTEAVFDASTKLLAKDVEYIELPAELENFERQMNYLKRETLKNERMAKESEQKKNDLVVYLAHDLKTPLTSMIGYLSLLDEIKDMPKKQREKYVKVALEKSYRLEDLINELFDITRFNSETIILEKEEINLNMMFEQLIDDFYPLLKENGKDIKLEPFEKIILNGDPDKLGRVFGNLIKNAIFYSLDSSINISVLKNDDFVKVIISNKGKKISAEKLGRIFEKFYRLDGSRGSKNGGSGLGLAIAKEIVELHGGKITASSDDDYTKFYVELPLK